MFDTGGQGQLILCENSENKFDKATRGNILSLKLIDKSLVLRLQKKWKVTYVTVFSSVQVK